MSFDGFLGGFPDEDEEEPLYFEKLLLPYRVEKLTLEKDLGAVLTGSGSRPIVVVMEGPAAVYPLVSRQDLVVLCAAEYCSETG